MQSKLFDLFIYNIRMARNQTVTGTVHNIFALNRVRKECYYEPIRVDFSAIQKPNNQNEDIIPFFNKDGNYFTPSFILRRQTVSLQENLANQKNKFEARISHSQNPNQEDTPQYRPTDSKYCQLCQQYFADYWQHINAKYHKRMINSSKFNKDIMALCKSMVEEDQTKNPLKKKKIEKKKVDKKNQKTKEISPHEKDSKLATVREKTDILKKQTTLESIKADLSCSQMKKLDLQRKSIQESLKITLQLGNYSTNLVSNNTFKQLFQDS